MASYMREVREINRTPMADAAEAGSVFALPAELHREYIRMNLALRSNSVGNRLMSLVMCEHGGKKIVLLFVHPGHEQSGIWHAAHRSKQTQSGA